MTTRRNFLIGGGAAAAFGLPDPAHAADGIAGLGGEIARIETESGGRLGVAILDTQSQARVGHRDGERFPMCSTFKMLAAGALLRRVDAGKEHLDRRIAFNAADVVTYSPATKAHAGPGGMLLAEICEAAITLSDNTAGNLMLRSLGGPQGVTAFARSLGDTVTRLDRIETALNEATPGDPRDTTTPAAMLKDMQMLLLGDILSAASKQQLTRWLLSNKTGGARLRAGLPAGWRLGDKTGAGGHGSTNDIGIIWPPQRAPILVTVYLTETTANAEERNAAPAAVGRAIAKAVAS